MRNLDYYHSLASVFKVLSHPVRLAILDILKDGEQCVCHLEAFLGYRQAYISQQLMVLRNAGLISGDRVGLNTYYSLVEPKILDLFESMPGVALKPEQRICDSYHDKCTCPKCRHSKPKIKLAKIADN